MDWLWTWGGKCFGYRDGDDLLTHDGRHVGRFNGDKIFDPRGRYLGELMNENRLIRRKGVTSLRGYNFTPRAKRAAYAKYANYVGYAMYAGYEDFPAPESL
ncbi:4-fold beta flower protein [Methylocystis parvus]|uniref:Uncharacterized protein n=1 Tax=Methylocystis parvus TaxID=134 RepID=A0A6B8ME66_9HYPH|nr:hypothetical protein [Methylocystis parvus]QGN00033.1 hypothetical protein F7D14_20810 [Methylocystis parvus]WBK02469.1 hypothetical protein MMG94_21830 [Methylocystis parvus OBBP]